MDTKKLSVEDIALVERGLASLYKGRLIPVIRGASPEADPLFPDVPEDYAALSDEDLAAFITDTVVALSAVKDDPASFVNDERTVASVIEETKGAVEALEAAKAEQGSREPAAAELNEEEFAAEIAALTESVTAGAEDDEPVEESEPAEEPAEAPAEPAEEPAAEASITAAAAPARRSRPMPKPSRDRQPVEEAPRLSLVASVEGPERGQEIDLREAAELMIRQRSRFGNIGEGNSVREPIAMADWSHLYPSERKLGDDADQNLAFVTEATKDSVIRQNFQQRKKEALVASGGLCAPVTPYYNLQMISVADRPVRGALAAFNADRGGIRYARPAGLSAVTSAVGEITAENDALGGTFATKSCQVVPCPAFQETDVTSIYHCLQHGNLGSRTFPERVMQWNGLTLAAHARFAESLLLTAIKGFSTSVTASSLGLGAVGALVGQVLVGAAAIRNRNRMADDAVLRVLLPAWVIPLLVSDEIRSEFYRLGTDRARITAYFREANIEPTFYLDGSADGGQVFGTQGDGDPLLAFPGDVEWAIYPEGSFVFLDGGTLELGIVRDSVLNSTNDYQIFGETFENVAFVGVESMWVTSTLCDSGIVAGTHNTVCPIDYVNPS